MFEKVTVIVPIYNTEKYLKRCITSILNQSYPNFELILINDGSTDSSFDICNDFQKTDKRIIVFHTENSGVSNARNLGIKHATGKYILFIDSDDEVSKDYISSFFLSNVNYENCLIIQGCYVINNSGKIFNYIYDNEYIEKKDFSDFISKYEMFMHGGPTGKFYNAKIIKQNNIQFKTEIHNYEDLIFFLEYIEHIKSVYLSSKTGYYYHIQELGLHKSIHNYNIEENILSLYTNITKKHCLGLNNTEIYKTKLLINIIKSIYRKENYDKKGKLKKMIYKYSNILKYPNKYISRKDRIVFFLLKNKLFDSCDVILRLFYK